jgi:hypothetical protein
MCNRKFAVCKYGEESAKSLALAVCPAGIARPLAYEWVVGKAARFLQHNATIVRLTLATRGAGWNRFDTRKTGISDTRQTERYSPVQGVSAIPCGTKDKAPERCPPLAATRSDLRKRFSPIHAKICWVDFPIKLAHIGTAYSLMFSCPIGYSYQTDRFFFMQY